MNTITFTARTNIQHFTVAELNTLFNQIKTVLDAKLDVRGDTVEGDLRLVNAGVLNAGTDLERN